MNTLPVRLAVVLVGVNVLGAIAAVILDLRAAFVLGEQQDPDIGVEVIWQGSATSAPWPPLLVLIIGTLLAAGTGKLRSLGLALFVVTGLVMVIGVIAEFVEGASFAGIGQLVFLIFSAALAVLAVALALASIRALASRSGAS